MQSECTNGKDAENVLVVLPRFGGAGESVYFVQVVGLGEGGEEHGEEEIAYAAERDPDGGGVELTGEEEAVEA